ncbi:hypothetical protein G7Z17_g5340 [Cylindrodendrum hubeiense]|uniref:Uncharacterized protein n=1 Tax=Cylindrodendrum hubeiense TaxID=595255 RepID=A0A9P5HD50_9HYPO|nr:hypothetical protein G7Z17_g5340 [Cylindrodendrum hubeiense]
MEGPKDHRIVVPVNEVEAGASGATDHEQPHISVSKRRHATVYDAVADEVLFRRKDAPDRYLEHDIYYAHERDLPSGGQDILPESDLLKAVHSYASSFYSSKSRDRHPVGDMNVAGRSMDETALLAFGILLEEAGKEVLGRRGDLVFTEGADDAPGLDEGGDKMACENTRIVGHHDVALRRRGPKRRKVADSDDE